MKYSTKVNAVIHLPGAIQEIAASRNVRQSRFPFLSREYCQIESKLTRVNKKYLYLSYSLSI